MKNTRSRNIPPLLGISIAILLCLSCITLPLNLSKNWVPSVKHRSRAPVDAFALIQVIIEAEAIGCESATDEKKCDTILKELPSVQGMGSGSGLLVNSDLGPGVLTAAHVCEHDVPDTFEHDGVKISILSMTRIRIKVPTRGLYAASIIRMDKEKDLCLLRPETVFTHPVPIAEKEPQLGDVVYSIGAPYGIGGPELALIFKGFYSGKDKFRLDNQIFRFYTIPTRPGSSGSPVFNKNWEVIGVIHTAFKTLESVGVGTGLQDVRNFLFSPVEVTVEIEKPGAP